MRPQRSAPRLDATNLAGITTLMNPQHVKQGINLETVEKSIMGKNNQATSKRPENDPVQIYTAELNQLAEELGIDLVDDDLNTGKKSNSDTGSNRGIRTGAHTHQHSAHINSVAHQSAHQHNAHQQSAHQQSAYPARVGGGMERLSKPAIVDINMDDDDDDASDDDASGEECSCTSDCPDECDCECHEEDCSCTSECPDECECDCHYESGDEEEGSAKSIDDVIARFENDLGISSGEHKRNKISGNLNISKYDRRDRGDDRSDDNRRKYIDDVVGNIRNETHTTYGAERERIQDIKASKLEQIGQLQMTLEEEGIDCSGVSKPTNDSSVEEIDSVLSILRLKNDRNRYSSIAEEVILGLAEGIETVFDGSRTVPLVGWKPDYTGYHNTVSVKLHRMRSDTSQIVGNIIEKYKIGPTARILMELFPSFLLYSRHQKKQKGTPGLSSDPHVSNARMAAMNRIRESDDRDFESVRNL